MCTDFLVLVIAAIRWDIISIALMVYLVMDFLKEVNKWFHK